MNKPEEINSYKALKLTVIGGGNIFENFHLPVIKKIGLTINYVVETNAERQLFLKSILDKDVTICDKLEDINFTLVDIALIASPTSFHYEQAKLLGDNSIPTLCEKPLSTDENQTAEITNLFNTNNTYLQCGYYRRFQNSAKEIKKIIEDKTYGELNFIDGWCGWNAKTLPASITNKSLSCGGITVDYGVHVFDRLIDWFEDIELSRYYDDSVDNSGIETNAFIELIAAGYIPVKLRLSWTNTLSNSLNLFFEHAMIICNLNNAASFKIVKINNFNIDVRKSVSHEEITFENNAPAEEQWIEFLNNLEKRSNNSISDLSHSTKIAEFIAACYKHKSTLSF